MHIVWLMRCAAPALVIGLLAAAPRDAALRVTFASPAGLRPAGPLASSPFSAVLPSGRIIDPIGKSVTVGGSAFGFAITPDGRYAIVSSAEGSSAGDLIVVDTRTMSVANRFHGTAPFLAGVAAVRDPLAPSRTLVLASAGAANRVEVFDLDAGGSLVADPKPSIAITPPLDERFANFGWAVPSTIVASRDGRAAYVVDVGGANVATLDLATRTVRGVPSPVGFAPFGAALANRSLLVANEGLMAPGVFASPAPQPEFGTPSFEPGRSSSLSILPLRSDGTAGAQASAVQMDGPPDGMRVVGGAHPSSIVVAPSARYAFVAMAGVDRVATVALRGRQGRVVGGTELRLYNRGPYGTQPDALALSRDGRRLYVALAGIDAVAVLDARDPRHLHRLGLLPAGWQPTALAVSRDGRRLYVLNARGTLDAAGGAAATFQRIDLVSANLAMVTRRALASQRAVAPVHADPVIPPVFDGTRSAQIKHVVLVLAGSRTFDAMLGDLNFDDPKLAAVAEPSLAMYGAQVTPNLHALVKRFALAANIYNDAEAPVQGDALALGGVENPFESRMRAAGVVDSDADGIAPDAYPRLGYLYNTLEAHRASYRDYGVLLRVPGAAAGRYSLDAPTLEALAGKINLQFPSSGSKDKNLARAQEFERDFTGLTAVPDFVSIRLPSRIGVGADAAAIADQDRALGSIVQFLTSRPDWDATAIFVVPEAAGDSRDHVDSHRSYALVVSPYAKPGYVGMRHLSPASVLKTEEEILGLPALSLADALASDMSDFFTPSADAAPYTAFAPSAKRVGVKNGE